MKAIYSRIMSLIILSSLLAGLGLNPIQGSQAAPSGADIAVESPWKLETIGQISGPVRAVTVEGSYAYVGSGDMLTIFDLSSPASPLPVGSLLFVGSLLLGATTLREFALGLFIGVAAGTYYPDEGAGQCDALLR